MFMHEPERVVIVTDTLATTMDGDPFLFQNKCWPMPQMRMVMVGTGVAPLHEAWHRTLQTSMLARDIAMLNVHAPAALRNLWKQLHEDHPDARGTATVYHFGVPEGQSRHVRYTYRSEKNFNSECSVEGGFGVKPIPAFAFEVPDSLDGLIDLACRLEQDSNPKATRIHIGGELVLTSLNGSTTGSTVIHRFDDYDEMWQAMNDRLAEPPIAGVS
jgi:hypothetical protein